ncbi:mitochondrial dicarboxylate carrier-like isoform X2 [Acropora millepora]|uniref:mitochondrial dicarboxylate carrier-like isoform X2 n=1 Tax=Acropora millepora TaxID=45264 RepID=UPI0010FC908C|nr:mitochondrial dicarboxylate carrier-like isoform X2 [Acropora millepora]
MSVSFKEGASQGSAQTMKTTPKKHRWYLGGIASAMAACCTHPLDLLKVHLQTQQQATHNLTSMGIHVVRTQGVLALYNGLSASVMRQIQYPFTRKLLWQLQQVLWEELLETLQIWMQNDVKMLDLAKRRNYNHVFDGLYRTATEEGVSTWMRGVTMTSSRALLMTVAQIACYDQAKQFLLTTRFFKDNIVTHFTASFIAGTIATSITQPVDVMKTRLMEAKPGQYKSVAHCILYTAKLGPLGFYKGFIPAWVRLAPHTILTWIFLEQLRVFFPIKQ